MDKYNLTEIPKKLNREGLCYFGKLDEIDLDCELEYKDGYTNIYLKSFNEDFSLFKYLDGFSPNLNKKLHLGHLSNLIFAKTFQSLEISDETIAIYGDTLEGTKLSNKEQIIFDYTIDKEFYASNMKLSDNSILSEGLNEYQGTRIWNNNVLIKSDESTSYLYQDIALRQLLKEKTLYLTGNEQNNHFKILKEYDDNVTHLGLGLVTLSGLKMSSREGNVIFMQEVIDEINKNFNNLDITYNVLSGSLIKSNPITNKKIVLEDLYDVKKSLGLYVSYSLARLNKLPITFEEVQVNPIIKYLYLKSKINLNPSMLFNKLIEVCKDFNSNYQAKNSKHNVILYSKYKSNIEFMCNKLGFYNVQSI